MAYWGAPPPGGQPPYGPGPVPPGQLPYPPGQLPYPPGPYAPAWPGAYGQPVKVGSGVLVGVSLWRLVIVVLAITGFGLAMNRSADTSAALAALSQQASLLTAVCYAGLLLFPAFTGGRRHEPDTPWLRGALVVLMGLVSVTFLTLLGGTLSQPWSLFEHLLTPLAVLVDWIAVGRAQRDARWWFPFTWLAFPLAYLAFYLAHGDVIYPFLNPGDSDFAGVVSGFLAAVLAFGFVVYGIGKARPAPPPRGPVPGRWGA